MATRLTWCRLLSGDFVLALFVILQVSFTVKFWTDLKYISHSCNAPLNYWMLGLTLSLLIARLTQCLLKVSFSQTGLRVACSCVYLLCVLPFSFVWTGVGTYWYVLNLQAEKCNLDTYRSYLTLACISVSYAHTCYHVSMVAGYVYAQVLGK